MASTLITESGSSIVLGDQATFCQVFWQVGSSATLGTNSTFVGHILALESITANTGAKIEGQLLARNGAVTLHSNTITNIPCADNVNNPAPGYNETLRVSIIGSDTGTGTDTGTDYTGPGVTPLGTGTELGTESVLGSDIGSSQGTDSQVSPGRIALPTTSGYPVATSGYPVAEALSVMGMALLAIGGALLKKKLV